MTDNLNVQTLKSPNKSYTKKKSRVEKSKTSDIITEDSEIVKI